MLAAKFKQKPKLYNYLRPQAYYLWLEKKVKTGDQITIALRDRPIRQTKLGINAG